MEFSPLLTAGFQAAITFVTGPEGFNADMSGIFNIDMQPVKLVSKMQIVNVVSFFMIFSPLSPCPP
jgi:hypothetical protein